jgi:DNA helicase HerA-like ATPase
MTSPSTPAAHTGDAAAAVTVESPDGRSFILRGTWSPPPRVGDYVRIGTGDARLVGHVERVGTDAAGRHAVAGSLVDVDGPGPEPFPSPASVSAADTEEVARVVSGPDPRLHLGHLQGMPDVPLGLVARKLNRHTFWCGQSGSGKTYALGVALERILTATRLPVLVFDPNSDFVNLGRTVPGADPEEARAITERDVVVLRPDSTEHPLRIRFTELTARAKAAVLRLDPIVDRLEYNALITLAPTVARTSAADIVPTLRGLELPEATLLAQRIENLGLLGWRTVWSDHTTSVTDVVDTRPAATVLDLGSYDRHEEQLAIALGVLDHLWERRAERRPVLIVVDEAHNLCPPDPETPLGVVVRDRLVQIAAEGRKFGLWLLMSTQRPSKVHQGVVSQCDNLTLMRMNSRSDLEELGRTFGYVPEGLLERAANFGLGEALVAGGFVPRPSIVTMRDRVTVEGGSDVPVPMP